MRKNIFHDSRHISEKDDQKKTTTAEQIKQKKRVEKRPKDKITEL